MLSGVFAANLARRTPPPWFVARPPAVPQEVHGFFKESRLRAASASITEKACGRGAELLAKVRTGAVTGRSRDMHAPGSPWLGTTKPKPKSLLQLAKDIGFSPFDPAGQARLPHAQAHRRPRRLRDRARLHRKIGGPQRVHVPEHHCCSQGMPSPSPSISTPGQCCRK